MNDLIENTDWDTVFFEMDSITSFSPSVISEVLSRLINDNNVYGIHNLSYKLLGKEKEHFIRLMLSGFIPKRNETLNSFIEIGERILKFKFEHEMARRISILKGCENYSFENIDYYLGRIRVSKDLDLKYFPIDANVNNFLYFKSGDKLLDLAKSIGRSKNFMEKRYKVISYAIANFCLTEDYCDFVSSNISKQYRGLLSLQALSKRNSLLNNGDDCLEKIEDINKQAEYLTTLFGINLSETVHWDLQRMSHLITKEDLPYVMAASKNCGRRFEHIARDLISN